MLVTLLKAYVLKMKVAAVLLGKKIYFIFTKMMNVIISSHWEKRTLHHELMNGYVSR